MILQSVPDDLLVGLPEEDQAAIRAAVGRSVTVVGYDEAGRPEIEFADETGAVHTIWLEPLGGRA